MGLPTQRADDVIRYMVTGYCDGDFVLSATEGADGKWGWGR